MAKKSKKGKTTAPPPVTTGHDDRAKDSVNHSFRDRRGGSDAPDGVSGNWSLRREDLPPTHLQP